jgi:lipoprotein-anchoring transpeptidase ErfK/SrfK
MFESTSMSRHAVFVIAAVLAPSAAAAQYSAPRVYSTQVEPQAQASAPTRYAAAPTRQMGGGFVEFLFNGGEPPQARRAMPADPYASRPSDPAQRYELEPALAPRGSVMGTPQGVPTAEPARPAMDPRYLPQVVDFDGKQTPGTIVVDTPNKFLYLVEGSGKARRYGIGVGRPGFTWAGVKNITRKAEWPDWVPPPEMLQRRPDLPRHMAGGPENPLGARAMYLGNSLYRIHGSNEPWTIGTNVSSGCIRMRNEDVIDLYGRVKVGTRVVVI